MRPRSPRRLWLLGLSALLLGAAPPKREAREASVLDTALEGIASAPGLSLDEVASRVTQTSHDVEADRYAVDAADARAGEALVGVFPRVEISGRTERLSSLPAQQLGVAVIAPEVPIGPIPPGSFFANAPVSITEPIHERVGRAALVIPLTDMFLSHLPTWQAARSTRQASEDALKTSLRRTALQGRELALELLRANLAVEVAQHAVALARAQATDTSRLASVGLANPADAVQAQAHLAQTQQHLVEMKQSAQLAEIRLRLALHLGRDEPITVHADLRRPLASLPADDDGTARLEQAVSRRPEVQGLRAQVDSASSTHAAAWAGLFPHLDGYGELVSGDPNPRYLVPTNGYRSTWTLGLSLTYVPNDAVVAGEALSATASTTRELEARRKAEEETVWLELAQALARSRSSDAAVQTSARTLEAAESTLQARSRLFEAGKATATELLEARQLLSDAEMSVVNARVDQRLARLELEYATGDAQ